MKLPKVSIIIGAYNCERTILETVYSVIDQTFKDWELIIVDDCSSDGTLEKLKAVDDSRVNVIKLNKNSGLPAAARNRGIKASSGEFIAFIDHDDIWQKKKLETQLPHFQSPEIVGVSSDAVFITETPYYRQIKFGRSKAGYIDYNYIDILKANPIFTSSLIVRKQTIETTGLFDEGRDLFCIEDWDLWLRMARHGLFRVLEEPLLVYRVSCKSERRASEISKTCLGLLDKQVKLAYVKQDDIREPKVVVYLATARSLLEFDRHQSRRYYREAIANTSSLKRKAKGYVGVLVSFMPVYLIKASILLLYKADKILYILKEIIFQMNATIRSKF